MTPHISEERGYWEHLLLGHTQTAVVTVVSLSKKHRSIWEDRLTMFGLKKQELSHGNEECVTWDDMLPTLDGSYSLAQRLQLHDNSDTWANTQGFLTSACQPQRWPFVPATERQKHVPPVVHSGSWTDFQSPHALVWSPWVSVTQSPVENNKEQYKCC